MISIRTRCRGCASTALTPVLSLGAQVIAGSFGISKDFPPIARRIPLELVRCDVARDQDACGLVQLRHTVPGDLMYAAYGYRSGLNEAMAAHLAELARDMERRVRLRAGDLVVDIGANDGTLLAAYTVGDVLLYGFEPSDVEPERPLPRVHFIHDYFSARSLRARSPAAQARIVTSIAMFYDLDDPNTFVADVAAILAPDGLWAIELSYLPSMLAQNSFDTICHEHLEYYSLGPLERLLSRHGLAIADVSLNDVNGGSVRVLVCHQGSLHRERSRDAKARIYALKKRECELALDTAEPYDAFARRIDGIRRRLPALLLELKAKGKKVYGYGASTKGNVTLQYCGLTPEHLVGIADRNPAKWGTLTPGTSIPIISEQEMRDAKPDYLLALAWHFLPAFKLREADLLAKGCRFIVPMPDVSIV